MTNVFNPFLQRHSRAKIHKLFLIFWRNSLASISIQCWYRCILSETNRFSKAYRICACAIVQPEFN